MLTLLTGAMVFRDGRLRREDVVIKDSLIGAVGDSLPHIDADRVIGLEGLIITQGFADAHVHLREPGFSYKETVASGTMAAARGGYTLLAAMPNVDPVPDTLEHLRSSMEIFERDAVIRARAVAAITLGERGQTLSDIETLAPRVAGFSDDGKGVQSDDLMREAMRRVHAVGKPIMAHCEDDSLRNAGRVHDGAAARRFGLPGIPSECEWRQVERDLRLVRETGCRYHVQHASCRETVELIRCAKSEGLPVTCETAPHYLCLNDEDILDDARFIMNPPIRSRDDQAALIDGLRDGVIDMIATDHAPHTAQEKSGGLANSVMGVVGLETAFPVLYTKLALTGLIALERLLEAMITAPRALLLKSDDGSQELRAGSPADIAALDVSTPYTIDSGEFVSKGRCTPFDGWRVRGRAVLTMIGGCVVYDGRG
jgi:dihydroorotase